VIVYLLKSSACIAFVYLVYLFFFRYTDRFQLNRAYLLLGLVLSFLAPMIVLPETPVDIVTTLVNEDYSGTGSGYIAKAVAPMETGHSVIWYIYFSGVAISLLVIFISILKIFTIYRSGEKYISNGQTIVISRNIQPFSLVGILFIRSHDEDPIIIAHEMVHIRQRHWIDLVLVEIAGVVLWFNPFIYFYRRSIAIQHEYIADSRVTCSVSIESYLYSISRQLESSVTRSLVSGFNTQSIKQRIIMITSSKNYTALRYVIALPVVAIFVMAFATREGAEIVPIQHKELRCPVDAARLKPGEAVGFGNRLHPLLNKEVFHNGVDFSLATGNSVYAAATGTIVKAAMSGDYGNMILIRHGKTLTTAYAHLEKILVRDGDRVEAGQLIGTVGSTGRSTGPHLHFEVLENQKPVDPVPYLDMWID
jgi:hypothetical protein